MDLSIQMSENSAINVLDETDNGLTFIVNASKLATELLIPKKFEGCFEFIKRDVNVIEVIYSANLVDDVATNDILKVALTPPLVHHMHKQTALFTKSKRSYKFCLSKFHMHSDHVCKFSIRRYVEAEDWNARLKARHEEDSHTLDRIEDFRLDWDFPKLPPLDSLGVEFKYLSTIDIDLWSKILDEKDEIITRFNNCKEWLENIKRWCTLSPLLDDPEFMVKLCQMKETVEAQMNLIS